MMVLLHFLNRAQPYSERTAAVSSSSFAAATAAAARCKGLSR